MAKRGPFDLDRPSRLQAFLTRTFPERQFVVRTEGRVSYFCLTKQLQMAVSGVIFAIFAWGVFTSVSFVRHESVLDAKNDEIFGARHAYRSLLDEVAQYQRKFAAITRDLEENHSLMLGLVEKNAQLQRNLSSISRKLLITTAEREQVLKARERLKEQLTSLETEMQSLSGRNFALKDNLSAVESDLNLVTRERNKAQSDSARMRRRVDELTDRLQELQNTEGEVVQRMNERASDQIADLERVLEGAGIDIDQLLGGTGEPKAGVGGPFIPVKPDGLPASDLKAELVNLDRNLGRLETLKESMTRVPLAAPLPTYYITSTYGKRKDPITQRWSAHYGVDLGGPMKSKVFATAAGVVTFAGWKGRYGRLIEIDHGMGLKTRYGHLHQILVKKGQKVSFHEKIGLLGNTGRSTGPHLHYEVVFKDKPKNPLNFIRAGKYVFKNK
ncbi:MAG: peptidoglycan DD-metalloendopeptidase family protein [Rhodospirillaceae bacterium]